MSSDKPNRLANEKSPYLLQHAYNPVDWYPWGEEAFAKAQKENKPVFLSIGYSTCHWCHVMEEESFEDPEIAHIMNREFVSIKVDREERPDIDGIYMGAVMAMTGSGGWPLSVFLTSDRKPFYGGTYFPPRARWGSPGFKDILESIQTTWQNQQEKVIEAGNVMLAALEERLSLRSHQKAQIDKTVFDAAFKQFVQNFDEQYGGFGSAPKFPMGHNISLLLRHWKRAKNPSALSMVEKTLDQMARGGIYDHLGGGFHRYSTDAEWIVPHFEKMLYDQAVLARAYLEAYQATHHEHYAQVCREIFDYILRDMQDENGAFYSAEDADSVEPQTGASPEESKKREGAFYLWTEQELQSTLSNDEWPVFRYIYGIEKDGNAHHDPHGEFTGKNILWKARTEQEAAEQFHKPLTEINAVIQSAKTKLLALRDRRPRPHLDDKVLVDWNGLMISSLALGARVLNEPRYLQAAERAAQFILKNLYGEKKRLLRRYRDGESAILGTLDDYAFWIHGLLELFETTAQVSYLTESLRLTREMMDFFWDSEHGGFFFTAYDAGADLIIRQKEIYDGAVPSGNSLAVLDLIRLYHMTFESQWLSGVESFFAAFASEIMAHPSAYSQMLIAFDFVCGPVKEIVVVGGPDSSKQEEIDRSIYSRFLPNKVVLKKISNADASLIEKIPWIKEYKAEGDQPVLYVCENNICRNPVGDLREFEKILNT